MRIKDLSVYQLGTAISIEIGTTNGFIKWFELKYERRSTYGFLDVILQPGD